MDLGKAYFIYIYQADSLSPIVKSYIHRHRSSTDRLGDTAFMFIVV
jgi:hypothetical protein